MAKKNIYTGKLEKDDKWGGPIVKSGETYDYAAGQSVEDFVKESLNGKWGYVYDNSKGKLYIFTDEESCDLYLEHEDDDPMDPEIAALKLAELNSYSNYRIVIDLNEEYTKPTNAILVGQEGNEVVLTVNTYDKDDSPLKEAVNINYTITRPDGSKTFLTHIRETGEEDRLTVDNYINEGQNTVAVNVVGGTSNAVANTTIIYQVINLKVEDSYDISKVHDVSGGKTSSLSITWSVTGSSNVNKYIEWYVDGEEQQMPDPIPGGQEQGRRTETFAITSEHFSEGRHNIQYRAWLVVNEKRFYTPTYYKDFIVYAGGESPIVAASLVLPIGQDPFTGETYLEPVIYDMVQYTDYELPVAVYKNNSRSVDTNIALYHIDGALMKLDVQYSNSVENGQIWDSSIVPTKDGDGVLKITAENTVYTIGVNVEKNDLGIKEIDAGLMLNLRANGKSNSAPDRDQWVSRVGAEEYTTTFNGFTWDETSGWNNDELIISNGNSIEINCKPLTSAVKDDGLAFEIEFSTFNVSSDDAVICKIKNEGDNAPGILITASEAIFNDNAQNKVSTKFKSGENNRIAFVVDPETQGKPLMYIYVNGAACGAAGYSKVTSSFAADKNIIIEGTSQASIKLRHIRIYRLQLSSDEVLNNYILYRNTYEEMKAIYDRNNVYATAGVFDLNRISSTLPILLLTDYDRERNNIENLMSFGTADKSTPILLRQVQYINNLDPTTNFVVENAQMTCQGTSSMNYPKKNLRLYIKDKAKGKYGDWPLPITHTGTTMSDVEGTWKSKPGKGKIAFKSSLDGTSSEGERKPQQVNCWTFKADYAESSSAHNTGVARLWNQVMRDAALEGTFVSRTRAQAVTMGDPENKMDVRTTVDGFPCVVFYRYDLDDINWKFLGKYNFNNDKSTESVFGFCDIDGIAYQEYEYNEITEAAYEEAKVLFPDDWSSSTQNFSNVSDLEKKVREKVGKTSGEELTTMDYIVTLCATAYEYSKTYQRGIATIAGEPYMTVFAEKVMTAGEKYNKNYCVEVLENENRVSNFTADVDEFDSDWDKAFEFRYPEIEDDIPDADTKGGMTNLREFYVWCHSTMETESAYRPGMTVTISGETKHDEDPIYKQDSKYYQANGNYVVNTFEDFVKYQKLKFEKEKWDYLDIFKMAAYYVYLMRFGGVDQVVKNSMFTSEGTISYVYNDKKYVQSIGNHCKWFYINYDNDTILGLNNDGQLVYGPDIDRSTRTGTGQWIEHAEPTQEQIDACKGTYDSLDDLLHAVEIGAITPEDGDMYLVGEEVYEWSNESGYAYAGHGSVLWNNLEADNEFMTIVSEMDDALYNAGLTYNKTLQMFNEKQANAWCERILNQDAQFKYVDSYTKQNLNHLGKMQGPRTSHRTWWLNKRFTYFDSKFVSGEYKNKKVLFKADAPEGTTGLRFTIMPTELMNYGWGITNRANGQTGIPSRKDDQGHFLPLTFDVADGGMSGLAPGDPVEIYATPYISELDLSNFASYLMSLELTGVYNEVLGSQLKRLILGKEGKINTGASALKPEDFRDLEKADKLEYIDIQGFQAMTSLDLSKNPTVKEVYAPRSGVLAVELANGSRMERMTLPADYNTLILNGVNYLTLDNIIFENDDMSNVTKLDIINCDKLKTTSFTLLKKWYNQRNGNFANCNVDIQGFEWRLTYADLDVIETLKNSCESFNLIGVVTITDNIEVRDDRDATVERVNRIKNIFGSNCFYKNLNPPVYVTCIVPFVIINADKTEVTAKEGTEVHYTCDIYPVREPGSTVIYNIMEGEGYNTREGVTITSDSAAGTGLLTTEELVLNENTDITVNVTYRYTGSNDFKSQIKLRVNDPTYANSVDDLVLAGTTSLKRNNVYDYTLSVYDDSGKPATGTYHVDWGFSTLSSPYIDYERSGVDPNDQCKYHLYTSDDQPTTSDGIVLSAVVTPLNGSPVEQAKELLLLNENVILSIQSNPVVMQVAFASHWAIDSNVLTRDEALAVTDLGDGFNGLISNTFDFYELEEFKNLESIPEHAFQNSSLRNITIPESVSEIGNGAFQGCSVLESVSFADGINITTIPDHCFYNCYSLKRICLPETVRVIRPYAFGNTRAITKLAVGTGDSANTLYVPDTLTDILDGAFETVGSITPSSDAYLQSVEIPAGIGPFNDGHLDRYLLRGPAITEFKVSEGNIYYTAVDGLLFNKTLQTLYKYPCGKDDHADYYLNEDCFVLHDYAFSNTKLTKITLNQIVIEMGQYQFYGNSALTIIDMSASRDLKELTAFAFAACPVLETILFPPFLERIGTRVFSGLTVGEINLPNTVTTIGQYFITACNNLTSLVLPDSIVDVIGGDGQYLISDCANLESVVFPKYLRVSSNIANNCARLTSVTLPVASYNSPETGDDIVVNAGYGIHFIAGEGSSNVQEYLLPAEDNGLHFQSIDGCLYAVTPSGLSLVNVPYGRTSMTIAPGTVSIGPNTFQRNKITAVTIPDTVTSIGGLAFANCLYLTSIEIPDSVTSLGEDIFQSSGLRTAVLGKGVRILRNRSFQYCSNLESVVMKGNVTQIQYSAFNACTKLSALTICSMALPGLNPTNLNYQYGNNPFGPVQGVLRGTRNPSSFAGRLATDNVFKVQYFSTNFDYKGVKEDFEDLPAAASASVGDIWKVTNAYGNRPAGTNWVLWDYGWQVFTGTLPAEIGPFTVESSLDAYYTIEGWADPLLTPKDGHGTEFDSGCGFQIQYLTFADDIYARLYIGDEPYEYAGADISQIPYADGVMGIYQTEGDYAGYYRFSFSEDLISGKPIVITIGEGGLEFGRLVPNAYETHAYRVDKTFGSTRKLGAAKGPDDTPTVSKYDYDLLVSKMNYLDTKIRKILQDF